MDPFSITVGAVSLVDTSQKTAKSLIKLLRSIKHAPEELLELLEEVDKVEADLEEVKTAVTTAERSSRALDLLLKSIELDLLRLNQLIHFELVKASEKLEVRRIAWVTQKSTVLELTKKLRTRRHEIADVLSTAILCVVTMSLTCYPNS